MFPLNLTPMLCSILQTKKNKPNNYLENKYIKNSIFLLEKFFFPFAIIFIISIIIFIFEKIPKELSPREDRGAFFMILESPEEVHTKIQ